MATKTVKSAADVDFTIWGRDSGPHIDLSVECANPDDCELEAGVKYHGHLEHPEDLDACKKRETEIEVALASGDELEDGLDNPVRQAAVQKLESIKLKG